MRYILYNPRANNGIKPDFLDGVEYIDVIGLDYQKFFDSLAEEDEVVFPGGRALPRKRSRSMSPNTPGTRGNWPAQQHSRPQRRVCPSASIPPEATAPLWRR